VDTADVSDLLAWAKVLEAAGRDAMSEGKGIVSKGSLNIKGEARRLAPKGKHTPYYEASINYDVSVDPQGDIIGEIGPAEGRRQRGLGNLLEYGGPHNPPRPHHEPALDAEEPRYYQACEDLAARLVTRYG
jgi:hypothetical protein